MTGTGYANRIGVNLYPDDAEMRIIRANRIDVARIAGDAIAREIEKFKQGSPLKPKRGRPRKVPEAITG